MISAKRFAASEPGLFRATQDFVQSFAEVPDPVIFISSKAKSLQAKIAWTILGSTLFQDLEFRDVIRLLAAIYKTFPEERLWTTPVPRDKEIQAIAKQVLQGKSWSLQEHLPGIFWSVGSFVRHHQQPSGKSLQDIPGGQSDGLVQWATNRSAEEIWRDLGEIYFMGKGKPRPKAAATIYRLTRKAPLGLGIKIGKSRTMPPIPLSMGMRRFLSMLGPGKYVRFADITPEEKKHAAQQMLAELSRDSGNIGLAAHGIQFFLEKSNQKFICRDHFKTCNKCPLYKFCNSAF